MGHGGAPQRGMKCAEQHVAQEGSSLSGARMRSAVLEQLGVRLIRRKRGSSLSNKGSIFWGIKCPNHKEAQASG